VLKALSLALLKIGLDNGSTGFASIFAMRRDPITRQNVWDISLTRRWAFSSQGHCRCSLSS
jgi:hypothetical protein